MGDRLQEIKDRDLKATPGPWTRHSVDFREHRSHSVKCASGAVISFQGYAPDGGTFYNNSEFIAHAREDIPWLLGQLDEVRTVARGLAIARDGAESSAACWQAHADADHAKLEQVAELVQQWRAKGAQADFLGVVNVWDEAADQLAAVLAKEATDDHEDAETIRYTADVVLLTDDGQVLLIQRGHDPHAGKWALPGGHVDQGESSRAAAARELAEEAGITFHVGALRQVGVFDDTGRDPRGRYVTIAYAAAVDRPVQPMPGDDAVQARWWPVTNLPELAFDHAEILGKVLAKQ